MRDGFGDYRAALRLRDLIHRIVRKQLKEERPPYRYAEVVSIDLPNRVAQVLYPEDTVPVPVPFGMVAVPTSPGQRVRIDGLPNDRFISDVLT